tara:strand:- start:852 stop:1145 length:294 start_codon:yes stop_codon:yes gene_type:complete
MSNYKKQAKIFDKIAANRISKVNGGLDFHVALGSRNSITLRNKFKRLGLEGEHISDLIKMVDEISIQNILETNSIGVRFATVKGQASKPKIWGNSDD